MPQPPPKEALEAKAQKPRQAQSEKALEAKAQTPRQAQSEEVLFANFQMLRQAQSEEAWERKAKMSEEALETKAKRSEEVLKTKAQTSEEAPGAKDQMSEEALQAGAHTSIIPGGCAYHYRPEGVPSRMRLNASEDEQWIEETLLHGERVHIGGMSDSGVWAFVRTFRTPPGQGWIRLEHLHGISLPIRPPPRRRA